MLDYFKKFFTRSTKINLSDSRLPDFFANRRNNRVDQDTVFGIPQLYGAVKLICSKYASLPSPVYKVMDDGGYLPAKKHPAYKLLTRSTDGQMLPYQFKFSLLLQTIINGNGIALIHRDYYGDPIEIELLDSNKVTIDLEGKAIIYKIDRGTGTDEIRYSDEIIHLTSLATDGVIGLPIWEVLRTTLGLSLEVASHAEQFFKNGCRVNLKYTLANKIRDENHRKNIRENLNKIHQGIENSWNIALVEQGDDLSPIGNTSADLTAICDLTTEQSKAIALILQIPMSFMGLSEYTSHNSLEQQQKQFLADSIEPYLIQSEQAFEKALLTEKQLDAETYFIEFDRSRMITLDEEVQEKIWTDRITNGKASFEEYRQFKNLPVKREGQYYMLAQVNPIDKEGKPIVPEPVAPPAPAVDNLKIEEPKQEENNNRSLEELKKISVNRLITRVKKDLNTRGVKEDLSNHVSIFEDNLAPFSNHKEVIETFFEELKQELTFVSNADKIDFDRYAKQIIEGLK